MCDEVVDDSLAALKLIPDWFVTNKMVKKYLSALYANENILYFNEDSGDAVFNYNEMGIVNTDLNDINLDNSFDKDDPEPIILIRPLVWHIQFEKRKELKKKISEELTQVAWHPNRWWNVCVPEDEKK